MITYVNSKNNESYQLLYDRAESDLKTLGGERFKDVNISTLEEYFYYLPELIKLTGNGNDDPDKPHQYYETYGRRYTMLPLDEEYFSIDANTRVITVPDSFKKNGIAVQGDQVAEVVYFKIARYFDYMDLNNAYIIIQWEVNGGATGGETNGKSGTSMEWVRDIESEPDYLIFGWALNSDITQYPGTLKFSVRFVTVNAPGTNDEIADGSIEYSFSTLDAQATINKAINTTIDLNTLASLKEANGKLGTLMTNRVKSLELLKAEKAKAPEFRLTITDWVKQQDNYTDNIYTVDLIGNNYYPNTYYIYKDGEYVLASGAYNKEETYYTKENYRLASVDPENYNSANLFIKENDEYIPAPAEYVEGLEYFAEDENYQKAEVSTGSYLFKVEATNEDGGTIEYTWYNGKQLIENTEDMYVPVIPKDIEITSANQYFKMLDDHIYYVYNSDSKKYELPIALIKTEDGRVDLGAQMLYERFGAFTATQAGAYTAVATNHLTYHSNSVPYMEKKNLNEPDKFGPITIPGPSNTLFGAGQALQLDGSNNFKLILDALPSNPKADYILYQWTKDGAELTDKNTATLELDASGNNKPAEIQGKYVLKTTAYKNNAYVTNESGVYTVTYEASEIDDITLSTGDRIYKNGDNVRAGTKIDTAFTLVNDYQIDNGLVETEYQWYYQTDNVEEKDGELVSIYAPIPNATQSSYTLPGSITVDTKLISLLNRNVRCKITNKYNGTFKNKDSIAIQVVNAQ